MVSQPSNLYNGNPYMDKMHLYIEITPQVPSINEFSATIILIIWNVLVFPENGFLQSVTLMLRIDIQSIYIYVPKKIFSRLKNIKIHDYPASIKNMNRQTNIMTSIMTNMAAHSRWLYQTHFFRRNYPHVILLACIPRRPLNNNGWVSTGHRTVS